MAPLRNQQKLDEPTEQKKVIAVALVRPRDHAEADLARPAQAPRRRGAGQEALVADRRPP